MSAIGFRLTGPSHDNGTMFVAHETWFTDLRPAFDWAFAGDPASLVVVAGAIAIAVAWRLVARRVPRPELAFLAPLGRFVPWVPRLLAIHAGVSLLSQAARGTFLAPGLALPDSWFGTLLAVVEGLAGVWFITGFRLRIPAYLLVAAGPLGMAGYGVVPILERMDLLGIAAFLAFLPPSDDAAGRVDPPPVLIEQALVAMRVLVGGSLIVLAFTEKLARPELALAFLDQYPAFNILQAVGWSVSDVAFVRLAGGTELLFGLLIISGAMPQLTVIVAGIPFNVTLFFLGAPELIGHLPIYGAMLALLVYGSNRATAHLVAGFPAPARVRSLLAPWRPAPDRPHASTPP